MILFLVMNSVIFKKNYKPGNCSYIFLICYGSFRIISELFREPDSHVGFIFNNITMGQILSVPMIFIGILFLYIAFNYKNREF